MAGVDLSSLTCVSPRVLSSGLVELRVVLDNGESVAPADKVGFEYMQSMQVNGMHPTLGQIHGGQVVSIFGENFVSTGLQCKFGDHVMTGAQVRWRTSSLILCMLPPATSEARVMVRVSANDGADFTDDTKYFLYRPAFIVDQLVPNRGFATTRNQGVTILGPTSMKQQSSFARSDSMIPWLVIVFLQAKCDVPFRKGKQAP